MKRCNVHINEKFHIALGMSIVFLMISFYTRAYASEEPDDASLAESMHPYRILCISSYNYAYPTVPDQLNGLAEGLGTLSVDIDYEFMDAKNYYKSADFSAFHDYLSYKIAQADPYDLVVLCDDTALHFGLNYYEELFDDIPIVFTSVNNQEDAEAAATRKNVTGITQKLDFYTNRQLAEELFPQRTHLIVIVDNTSTAQGEFKEFQKAIEYLPLDTRADLTVINASNYSKRGLERAISEINQPDSLIIYFSCLEDGEGNIYTLKTGTMLIVDNAPDVPIWRMTLSNMGYGVFGGISYSYYDAGIRTGEIAARILTGTDPKDIPIESNSVTHAYFDQQQLDKFGIRASQLPLGATILNETQSPWSFYKQHMLIMNFLFVVIVLLTIIIIILIIMNRQHAKLIHQDFLTQMPNRPYIMSRLESVIDSKAPFGIIMMDVDHFKNVNDTRGHVAGDELLIGVANRLKAFPEKQVVFARIGGDEFMGLIFDATKEKARQLCQELVATMKPDFELSDGPIHITISAGAAVFPEDTERPQFLQNFADAALYETKKNGRNGYELFHPALKENIGKKI